MKTKIIYSFLSLFVAAGAFAQDRTTVTATNYDVSDNLDLKAVASIFGDSRNLEDFEQRLNDPDAQISNLDLNNDNEVDYIRVIESTQDNTRLVILQAVLDRDVYQDVATIEVERRGNDVQVQVVGDVYMYGPNYIYEPVYVARPVFFDFWWTVGYRPYVSTWYWGYYPHYWHVWHPMPIYRYRNHVHVHINVHNHYNYVNVRRSRTAAAMYSGRRSDAYARRYPERSFNQRHANVANRHELDKTRRLDRGTRNEGIRGNNATRTEATRGTRTEGTRATRNEGGRSTRSNESGTVRNATRDYPTRSNPNGGREGSVRNATRDNTSVRNRESNEVRTRDNAGQRSETRSTSTPRSVTRDNQPNRAERNETPRMERSQPQRESAPRAERQAVPRMERQSAPRMERQSAPRVERQSAPRVERQSAPRMEQPRGNGGGDRGHGGGRGRD
ncbi:hypothetical protein HUK80_00770 [Flavobacterium sp. MAH-1]|uniref:DUF3300 domain-containing protein n=1 Tax=Flavobacterium agri TaxID=2743471 RepID=A0A7Y9C3T2_9FLAO|nr:hypothetical protein [Flavobacterium agri]NUY79411.1 hypothetical protein [Flavobacterium agri]NYA69436.1 hypothetical protein [Flavobacterium agri]